MLLPSLMFWLVDKVKHLVRMDWSWPSRNLHRQRRGYEWVGDIVGIIGPIGMESWNRTIPVIFWSESLEACIGVRNMSCTTRLESQKHSKICAVVSCADFRAFLWFLTSSTRLNAYCARYLFLLYRRFTSNKKEMFEKHFTAQCNTP